MSGRSAKRLRREQRDRLDHILPQGYLDGFTDPKRAGTLSVFRCSQRRWFESGTAGVAAARGFYDYSLGSTPDRTADETFNDLENRFPAVRRELVATGFSHWERHLDFLLAFAQMLRARSPLFREQEVAQGRQLSVLQVEHAEQVPSRTTSGGFDTRIKYSEVQKAGPEYETLLRNRAITNMRREIAKGGYWMSGMDWCLRLTDDPTNPVITGDQAVIAEIRAAELDHVALADRETLVFFPICWQACLIGSPAKFDTACDAFHPVDLSRIRDRYLKVDGHFAYSPRRLETEPAPG